MLHVVATPIGNDEDLSFRAKRVLSEAEVVIGEEHKVARRFLKRVGIEFGQLEVLNEHTSGQEMEALVDLCLHKNVALISDCGTPGFCDPGADLVRECRRRGIKVASVPGPTSLTALLSIAGQRLDRFLFRGFLPARGDERTKELAQLARESQPVVVMDTPYRLTKLLDEISQHMPRRKCILGLALSTSAEHVIEGTASQILGRLEQKKEEFVLILL